MFNIDSVINSLLIRAPIIKLYLNNITFISTEAVNTASTTGATIYYNPKFFLTLNNDEQKFVILHELFHIMLKHLLRIKGRDIEVFNYAADAVINQMIKALGFSIPAGMIDCPDAINYSVEEYYEIVKNRPDCEELMEKYRHEKQKEKKIISHDSWGKPPISNDDNSKSDTAEQQLSELPNISEQELIEKNSQMRKEENKKFREGLSQPGRIAGEQSSTLGAIGQEEQVLDWRTALKSKSQKVKSADYDFSKGYFNDEGIWQYPLEITMETEVEILIDTSISVNDDLVRSFLRECKNICADATIKIGCFDTKFYGFEPIRNEADIDNFVIQGRGGTDFNAAVRAFSPKAHVKIIFTDGYAKEPEDYCDALWMVYSKKEINPKGGQVYYVDADALTSENKPPIRRH